MVTAFSPPPAQMFGTRCLAPVLPLASGDRVLVVGTLPGLTHSLASRGATPLSVLGENPAKESGKPAGQVLPGTETLHDGSVAHAVVVDTTGQWWQPDRLAALARVLAPGGTLLLSARCRARTPRLADARTPSGGGRVLAAAGFTRTRAYGVRHGLHNPRFLVPLDEPGARQWFFNTYPPPHARNARLVALFARAPRTRADLLFFPHLLFTAERC